MPLASAVAGPYTCSHNAASPGLTRDGFRLNVERFKTPVQSDYYGESVIDSVIRGGNVSLTWEGIEYAAAVAVLTNHQFAAHVLAGKLDVGSTLVETTTLTAVAGTTAASTPASLSSTHSVPMEGQNELLFAAQLRTVPITLRFYPYDSSGTVIWFATT